MFAIIFLQAASNWLYVYPKGIQELLLHVKKVYNNPLIYITENGEHTLLHVVYSRMLLYNVNVR